MTFNKTCMGFLLVVVLSCVFGCDCSTAQDASDVPVISLLRHPPVTLQDVGIPSVLHSTDVPRVVYGRTPQAEWNAVDRFTDREVASLDDVDELLELIRDANADRPNREGLRPVRVRDLRSGAITTMQMTELEYLALYHLDQRSLYYHRARRATCADRDGRQYLFWSFPRVGDIARGIQCSIPGVRQQHDILAILVEPRYADLRVRVADAGVTGGVTSNETEEEYPVGCAIPQDGTVPLTFLCRRRAAPVHVTPAP